MEKLPMLALPRLSGTNTSLSLPPKYNRESELEQGTVHRNTLRTCRGVRAAVTNRLFGKTGAAYAETHNSLEGVVDPPLEPSERTNHDDTGAQTSPDATEA